jgi:hypothetical protein
LRPADAVAAVDRGEMAMLPPTYQSCWELAALGGTAEVLAAAAERDIRPIEPRLVVEGDSMHLELE